MERLTKDPSAKKNALFSPKQRLISAALAVSVLAGCSGDNNLEAGKSPNDQYGNTPIADSETPGNSETAPQTVYENVLNAGEEKLEAPYLEGLSGSELQNQVEQYLISYADAQTEIMQALSEANGEDFYYETPDMPDIKLSTTDPEKPTPEAAMMITYIPGYSGTSNAGGEFSEPAMLRFGSSMGSDSAVINFELNSSEPVKNFADVQTILDAPEQHGLRFYSLENEYGESLYITEQGNMESINAAGIITSEFSDSSIQFSRVGDTYDTIIEVRDQLARPGTERSWGELSNEEKFQRAGVDFTLDFAQKMAESEYTETTLSDYYGFGESFNTDITMPKSDPNEDIYAEDYEKRTLEGEETFCLKEETEYCEEPEDIIRMSMQQYPDGSGGGMITANAFTQSELHGDGSQRLSVDLTYSKESPLSEARNPADVAGVLSQTQGEDATIDTLSAPAVGMGINYTFYKNEQGELTENHDTGATTGEFRNFGEHLESAISSIQGEAKRVYEFGEAEMPDEIR